MLGTVLKVVGGAAALLFSWAFLEEVDRRDREKRTYEGRFRAGLEDLALKYYGRPFDELDSAQQQAILQEMETKW